MRLVIQRVSQASVSVDNEVVGSIGPGLLVLLGIHRDDTDADIPWLVGKLANLRIFTDDAGKMNRSVQDINGGILVVSQFTLYGSCRNGRRPEFTQAAGPDHAIPLYENFLSALRLEVAQVATGQFGAKMDVQLNNDGPVTLILDGKSSP